MSKGSEWEGYCVDLLAQLAQKLDFKYSLKLVKDGRYGGLDSSGNWNGMIGEIIRGVSHPTQPQNRDLCRYYVNTEEN